VGNVNDVIESRSRQEHQHDGRRPRTPIDQRPIRASIVRDDLDALSALVATADGAQVPISMLADINYKTGPPSIRDENGQLVGFVFVDITTSDLSATSSGRRSS